MPRFHVSLPDGSEVIHEVTEELSTIGRTSDNTFQIEDASVSSSHAEVYLRGESVVFKDIGSTNGSSINGQTVSPDEEHPLQPGDSLILGHVPVRFATGAETEQSAPPPESAHVLEAAAHSVAPQDFSNASPFPKRIREKKGASNGVMALAVVSLLATAAAIYLVFQMVAPEF